MLGVMPDLTLYRLLLSQVSEKPDLTWVQKPQPCPEYWPLVLLKINLHRGKIQSFVVSDGTHQLPCQCDLADTYNKILTLEAGAIIHLVGATPRFSSAEKRYTLWADSILTLKEYDQKLSKEKAKTEKRRAKLQAVMQREGYLPGDEPDTEDLTTGESPEEEASTGSLEGLSPTEPVAAQPSE
jgi:hypothetical protein